MPPIKFSQLHRRRIEVRLAEEVHSNCLQGTGYYEIDPDLGSVLRIAIPCETEDTALLLCESEYQGSIELSMRDDCDYFVPLQVAPVALN